MTTINDAGAYIPDAIKHLRDRSGREEGACVVIDEKVERVRLFDLWAEPNWQELKEGGAAPDLLAQLYVMYKNIRKKPRNSHWGIDAERWSDAYTKSIGILKLLFVKILRNNNFEMFWESYLSELEECFPDFNQAGTHISEVYFKYSTGSENSNTRIASAFTLSHKDRLIQTWLSKNGWPENKNAIKYRYYPLKMQDGTWRIATTRKKTYEWRNDQVLTKEAAILISTEKNISEFSTRQLQTDEIEPIYVPKKRNRPAVNRQGKVVREADVSAEEFLNTFGFRGLQFGNTMGNIERQVWINDAFDAFCDLADTLNFNRKWIGLSGLGIAFGARGSGSASAHYEHKLNVINLTRASGAGSAAHEWAHALDHKLSKNFNLDGLLSENIYEGEMLSILVTEIPKEKWDFYLTMEFTKALKKPYTRKQVSIIAKYKEILDSISHGLSISSSDFYTRSLALAKQKGGRKYWTLKPELFARAFESFIQDSLSNHGTFSPWLVHGTLENDADFGKESMWPYPSGEERRLLNIKFSELIVILSEK